jgi:hypothetical protein
VTTQFGRTYCAWVSIASRYNNGEPVGFVSENGKRSPPKGGLSKLTLQIRWRQPGAFAVRVRQAANGQAKSSTSINKTA